MSRAPQDRASLARRTRVRPALEALESRLTLSGAGATAGAMSLAMDAHASGMIGGVATKKIIVLGGQTIPGSIVRLEIGGTTRVTRSAPSGDFRFRLAMPTGTYRADVRSVSRAGVTSEASMAVTRGDAVIAWDDAMIAVIKADQSNVGLATRTMAMVSSAVYDAVNDIERTHAVFRVDVKAPATASTAAAASEAAYAVLATLDPAMKPALDAIMAQSLAAVPAGPSRTQGVAVGQEVAAGILTWRAGDGSAASVPYVPGTAPGQWRPTPPNDAVAWGPEWGQVEPFAVASVAKYVAPPPPALDSPEYTAALAQVESLGAADSSTRTADQTQIGIFWAYDRTSSGTPPVHYDQIAADVALQQHNTLSQNARLFGLVNVAMADAGIAAWDTKYTYNFWRPVTAIRAAAADGNPADTSLADPTWTPLGIPNLAGVVGSTPAFPGYVSGHASFGSALFAVLGDFYGTDKVHFTIGSDELPGVTRSYDSFSQASLENAWSRVYLGLHFWFDETAALTMGNALGNDVYGKIMGATSSRHA